MPDEWFCEIEGREIGPLSFEQLRAMVASGQILRSDGVRQGAHSPWLPAQNVTGLFSQASDATDAKPAVPPPSFFGDLPVAQPSPEPPAFPPTPPLPPPLPPMPADITGSVIVRLVDDPPDADPGGHGGVEFTALLRSKRRVRQQQMTVILLLTAIVGLAIAGLLLAVGGFSGSDQNKPATAGAKKAHAGQSETESPEALESQGAESLDKRRKSSTVEPSKKRAATSGKSEKVGAKTPTPAIGRQSAAASSERAETGKPSGSKEAEPKKKPREPQPGTPEGDFGLPEVDKSIE